MAEQTTVVQYTGPLPPAAELRRYEEALPGLAERIVAMAEGQQELARRQQNHDHDVAMKALDHNHAFENRGQFFVFFLLGAFVLTGFWFIATGHPYVGAGVLSPGPLWMLLVLWRWLTSSR